MFDTAHDDTRDSLLVSLRQKCVDEVWRLSSTPDEFGALDPLDRSMATLANADVADWNDETLCDAALHLRSTLRRLRAAESHVLAELDARSTCDIDFGHRTAAWLAIETHEPANETRRAVRIASMCRRVLTDTDRALTEGVISHDHARVMVAACNPRIEVDFAALQPSLIERAGQVNFARWQSEVNTLAALLDQDGSFDPDRDEQRERERTRATVTPLFDGSTQICAELFGQDALTVSEAIHGEADRLFHQYRRDNQVDPSVDIPGRPFLQALALVSLCRKGLARDVGTSQPPRPEAFLLLDPADPQRVQLSNGEIAPLAAVADLLADPQWRVATAGSGAAAIDLSPARRFASVDQRKALAVRDGGCIFPGCTLPPPWTDAHHVVPHSGGGKTIMENLASLCRHHHGVTHRAGWKMETNSDALPGDETTSTAAFRWITPKGRVIYSQHRQRTR